MVLTTVRIFDTTTRELIETVPLTMSAFGSDIAVSADGKHVYVAGKYYEGDAHNGHPHRRRHHDRGRGRLRASLLVQDRVRLEVRPARSSTG